MDFVFFLTVFFFIILTVQDTSAGRTAEIATPVSAMMKHVPMGKM